MRQPHPAVAQDGFSAYETGVTNHPYTDKFIAINPGARWAP